MGLAQAVSLPRGGGTLKGQCPLPAAAGPPPPPPPPPASRPPDPLPRGHRRPQPGRGREGARGAAQEVALPRERGAERGRGARAEGAWRAGSQAASGDWAAGARRARCQAPGGGGEERTGRKPGGEGQGREGARGRVPVGARGFLIGCGFASSHKDSVRWVSVFPSYRQEQNGGTGG